MAKKEKDEDVVEAGEPEGDEPPKVKAAKNADAAVDKPYEELVYAGQPMLRCKYCPWDTLKGEREMMDHIHAAHHEHSPPRLILVADARGKEVKE